MKENNIVCASIYVKNIKKLIYNSKNLDEWINFKKLITEIYGSVINPDNTKLLDYSKLYLMTDEIFSKSVLIHVDEKSKLMPEFYYVKYLDVLKIFSN